MALYIANAQSAASPAAGGGRAHAPNRHSLSSLLLIAPGLFMKNAAQGAGAGFLTLEGSKRVSEGARTEAAGAQNAAASEPGVLETLLEAARGLMSDGSGVGVMLIAGALFLFLTAGKGGGRTIGLLGFVAALAAYANGYDLSALAPLLQSLGVAG